MEEAEEKSDGQTLEYVNLILAIVLAALATPIVKWLVVHGGKLGIANPNAISFCNILFVGNICSGIVVLATFGWGRLWLQLKRLDARTSLLLAGNILVGTVVAPILLYTALETTMVTNLVLLTRIEAVALVKEHRETNQHSCLRLYSQPGGRHNIFLPRYDSLWP